MLESLSVKNFRNFRRLEIEPLSRVNLIVGKNNSGKSNLLDAISIYAAAADLNWIAQVLERHELLQKNLGRDRDFVLMGDGVDVYSSLFFNWNKSDTNENQIVIEAVDHENTKKHVEMRIVRLINQPNAVNGTTIKVLEENEQSELPVFRGFRTFSSIHKHKMLIFDGATHFSLYPEMQFFVPFCYVSTRIQRIAESNESQLWGNISISSLKSIVLDALKMVDDRIIDFNYIARERMESLLVPYVRLKGSETPTPLHSLGDGVLRVLSIVLNLISAKNGLLLIDEFENGLHYTVQEPLWRTIFQIAEELNVQVFATTHSEDCLRAFNDVLLSDVSGQVINLAKIKDDIECSIYKAWHLEEALAGEMEVR